MLTPTIHLNGTTRENLLAAISTARGALTDAIIALREVAPNGRDYYPQGPDALQQARATYVEWHAKLAEVNAGLLDLAVRIDQTNRRKGA